LEVKHAIKSLGKDITNEIIVGYTAEEIVKHVFPVSVDSKFDSKFDSNPGVQFLSRL